MGKVRIPVVFRDALEYFQRQEWKKYFKRGVLRDWAAQLIFGTCTVRFI